MRPWLETAGVLILALGGAFGGLAFSKLRKPWWTIGYFLPLAIVILIGLARRFDALAFQPPFSWLVAGRAEFAIGGAACAMLLFTPLPKLSRRGQKIAVAALGVTVVTCFSILPFLLPAAMEGHLRRLPTNVDPDGICIQQTSYTCGPAAAATALRKLGLPAGEGELAALSHTTPLSGTQPDSLCLALNERYGAQGLRAAYRPMRTPADLRGQCPALAVVKFGLLVDHYVAVLEVAENRVIVGDPLAGRRSLTYAEFEKTWRHAAITLTRNQ